MRYCCLCELHKTCPTSVLIHLHIYIYCICHLKIIMDGDMLVCGNDCNKKTCEIGGTLFYYRKQCIPLSA